MSTETGTTETGTTDRNPERVDILQFDRSDPIGSILALAERAGTQETFELITYLTSCNNHGATYIRHVLARRMVRDELGVDTDDQVTAADGTDRFQEAVRAVGERLGITAAATRSNLYKLVRGIFRQTQNYGQTIGDHFASGA